MKKAGFTLIELLAVIVILAIIALIAVPIVIQIIDDTKTSSEKESVELYIDSVKKAVARKQLEKNNFNPITCEIQEDGNLLCGDTEIAVDMKGAKAINGIIEFSNGKIVEESTWLEMPNNNYYKYDNNIIRKLTEDEINVIVKKSRLPKEYQEIEYIESTGTQYIDTGIKHTGNDIKQVMTVSFTKYVSSGEYGLISTWGGGYNYSNLYLSTGKKILSYWNSNIGNSISVDLNTKYDIEHIYDLNGSYGQDHIRSLKVNDSIVSTYFSGVSTPNPHTFKIFCRWDLNHKSYMRLYALKLYVDGDLVRDYIPVLDINDRPCLFDKVSNTFFYNQGTGEFLYE